MKRPESKCKDCADRRLKCHVDCEKYAEYVLALEEWKKAVKAAKKADGLEVFE